MNIHLKYHGNHANTSYLKGRYNTFIEIEYENRQ